MKIETPKPQAPQSKPRTDGCPCGAACPCSPCNCGPSCRCGQPGVSTK